jgi:hypothetical protein
MVSSHLILIFITSLSQRLYFALEFLALLFVWKFLVYDIIVCQNFELLPKGVVLIYFLFAAIFVSFWMRLLSWSALWAKQYHNFCISVQSIFYL